jgi:superfamily I DNA/RNA helicase
MNFYQELLKQKEEMAMHFRQLMLATLRIQEQHELLR